jgi:hypothetical protein
MALLTLEQRQDRLRFDYQVAMQMRSPIMAITAYRNADDLEKRQKPIVSEEDSHLATHYLVDYYVQTLIGPGSYSDKTSVKFDLLANGNYPYSRPGCFVVSSKMPWTPHFRKNLPICIDHDMWEDAQGKMLLGPLMVHVAKLLNFDEIPRSDNYGGYNPEAAEYWRTHLNRQPINPHLVYPPLPTEVSLIPAPVMRPKSAGSETENFFKPKSVLEDVLNTRLVGPTTDQTSHLDFRPARKISMFTPKSSASN